MFLASQPVVVYENGPFKVRKELAPPTHRVMDSGLQFKISKDGSHVETFDDIYKAVLFIAYKGFEASTGE